MLLEGKLGLIVGVANRRSLAWGIAQAVSREGARLAVTYQGERLERNVRELAKDLDDPLIVPCDVTRDEDIDAIAESVGNQFGALDFMIHAVAFALREELEGDFLKTSREGYRIAQDISSYSLTGGSG
jgi:enoyl-[acyl-carrier protein] reductase I